MDKIKFTDSELKKLRDTAIKLETCIVNFGRIYVEQRKIQEAISDLKKYEDKANSEYSEALKEEDNFLAEITKKYGEGNVDINTGEFIPNIKK